MEKNIRKSGKKPLEKEVELEFEYRSGKGNFDFSFYFFSSPPIGLEIFLYSFVIKFAPINYLAVISNFYINAIVV